MESWAIIQGIMERGYLNQSFPFLGPYEGARLEKYLQISAPLPRRELGTYGGHAF